MHAPYRGKPLPFPVRMKPYLIANLKSTNREELLAALGPPHFVERDTTRTAGSEEDMWAWELESGTRLFVALEVTRGNADIFVDPLAARLDLSALGIDTRDPRLEIITRPIVHPAYSGPIERKQKSPSMPFSLGPMPPRVGDAVARLIAVNPSRESDERLHGLLLTAGPGGGAYLSANGNVWLWHYALDDKEVDLFTLVEDGPRKVGLVAIAAERVPELREWLPRRPADAVDCRLCSATGNLPPPHPMIQCPECNGMGWRPDDRAAHLEERIRWRIGKHWPKMPIGRTLLFEQLPDGCRSWIADLAISRDVGRPVLVAYDSTERLTLIGTSAVVSIHSGRIHECQLDQFVELRPRDRIPLGASSEEVATFKRSWEYLRVTDRDGLHHDLWLPAGSEAYAFQSTLLMLGRMCAEMT